MKWSHSAEVRTIDSRMPGKVFRGIKRADCRKLRRGNIVRLLEESGVYDLTSLVANAPVGIDERKSLG